MMPEVLLILLMLLGNDPACKATEAEFLVWGNAGQGIVETGPVPKGQVWIVRAAGVFTTAPFPTNFMMEINRPVRSQGNTCCWRIPVTRTPGAIFGTPVLALNRPLVLLEGETLTGRTSGIGEHKIGMDMVYYKLPRACLNLLD